MELDPLSAEIRSILGWDLYYSRRYDQAAVELHKTLNSIPTIGLDTTSWARCMRNKAVRRRDRGAAKSRGNLRERRSWPLAEIARDYALAGRLPEARQALLDLLARSQHTHVSPYGIAKVYAALGDKDQAFAQLEQA